MTNRLALRIEDCRRAVQVRYRLTREEMMGPGRNRRISHPRQMAMTLARELTGTSVTMIGRHFGRRDHTTVIHAMRAVGARVLQREAYALDVDNVRLTLAVYRAQIEQAGWA